MKTQARLVGIVAGLLVLVMGTGCKTTLTKVIREEGFQRIAAPRETITPGTIVTTRDLPYGVIGLQIVCRADAAFPGLEEADPSPTYSRLVERLRTGTFNLEAAYLELIKADARFTNINKITLSLQNVQVLEQSDAEFIAAQRQRTPDCVTAIGWRSGNGQPIHTVYQVLVADVEYRIDMKQEASGSVGLNASLLNGLAPQLGASSVNVDRQSVSGKGQHLGVYLDNLLFREQPGAVRPMVVVEQTMDPSVRRTLTKQPAVLIE